MNLSIRLVKAGMARLLEAALSTGTPPPAFLGGTPHVALFVAGPGFNPANTLDLYTEPAYGGYARKPVVFGPPGVGPTGRSQVVAPSVLFSPTDDTASGIIQGCLLVSALTLGEVWGHVQFPAPVELASPDDDLTLVLQFAIPWNAVDWGIGSSVP